MNVRLWEVLIFFISVGAVNESSGKGKFYYVKIIAFSNIPISLDTILVFNP